MKKNSIYALIVTIALMLSACGSNSKEDSIDGGTTIPSDTNISGNISTALQSIIIDTNSGDVAANVNVTSTYVNTVIATLNNMDIALGGCPLVADSVSANPDTLTLNATSPSGDVVLSGKMEDPNCVPTSYQLSGTNTLEENGQTTTEAFIAESELIDLVSITFEDSSILALEVLTKQVDINESGVIKDIILRVTQGTIGIADKEIKIVSTVNVGSFSALTTTSDATGDAPFVYTSPNPIVDNNLTVEFCLEENSLICDTAQINLTTSAIVSAVDPIDNINYMITFEPNGGTNNLALGTRNNAIVTLTDKDTQDVISSDRVKSITVISRDTSVLKLTPEGGGIPAASIVFPENRNAVSVLLTADELNSGLALIEVAIEYFNLNGVLQTRGQLFSIAVLSGEATAFSINDNGVSYNVATKQFEHQFLVQATDASSNPIATTGYINASAMASFAKDASGREILYGKNSGGISATLSSNNGTAFLELVGGLTPFNRTNIKENRAFVAVFGDVETYEASGKWNLDEIVDGSTLSLSNQYFGEVYSNLGMAIGYNYRDKICTSAFEESVVVIDSTDGTYLLDSDGKAVVTLKYDSYMVGKRAMVLVNMTGLNPNTGEVQRSGEVHSQTLRFTELLQGKTVAVEAGMTLSFRHWGVIDTGTEDSFRLVNSVFNCEEFEGTDNVVVLARTFSDPTSCISSGQAYIDYTITTIDAANDGTLVLSKCSPIDRPGF